MTPDKHSATPRSETLEAPELVAVTTPELTPGLHEDEAVHTDPRAHGDSSQSEIPGPPDLVAATTPTMTPGLTDERDDLHTDREITASRVTELPGTAATPSLSEPVEDTGKHLAEWTRRNLAPVAAVGAASTALLTWAALRGRRS
ncbi:hypothetical protein [Nocardia noduli]|uniref:hypothetical protein n=1 Tax=Nocardia noduli TaxID=2815722 RepID=UPI001C227AAB|nr:hypothetical protein [Nocardia noduli]